MLTIYVVDTLRLAISRAIINRWRKELLTDAQIILCEETTDRATVNASGNALYVVVQNKIITHALVVQVFLRTAYKQGTLLADRVVVTCWISRFYRTSELQKLIKEHGITHIFLVPAGYIS